MQHIAEVGQTGLRVWDTFSFDCKTLLTVINTAALKTLVCFLSLRSRSQTGFPKPRVSWREGED